MSFNKYFSSRDERVDDFLYSRLHYYFGLPSKYALSAGRSRALSGGKLPLKTTWSGDYIKSFTIEGFELIPQFFLNDNRDSVYNSVDLSISSPSRQRFAYDFSRIQEGILSARLAYEGSPELQASDECRQILTLIYASGIQSWRAIPLVYAEPGPIYATTGIPDRIYIQLSTVNEAHSEYRNAIMRNIANHYEIGKYHDISIEVNQDRETSSMNFQAVIKQPEPEFPFGYYHSIGLIDHEGMVLIDSMLGKMRIPANSEEGKAYLLNAGKQESETQ